MRIEIFPTFAFNVQLHELSAVDLVPGFYQLRFRFKPSVLLDCRIACEQLRNCGDSRPQVVNATAISQPIRVSSAEENIELNDIFKCHVNVRKRLDKLLSVDLVLQLELWYLDLDSFPSLEKSKRVSQRIVHCELRTDRSVHCCRPIFFEYFSFCAVSLSIHSAVTNALPTRLKPSPDPPISEKFRLYHRVTCQKLLSSLLSLQNFIRRYQSLLTSPLNIECVEVAKCVNDLQTQTESSDMPWTTLQEQVTTLSAQLTQTFTQLVQLFCSSKELRETMHEEFDQMRMKQLSQAFVYVEDNVQQLVNPAMNCSHHIFDLIKTSAFLTKMPSLPLNVENVDVDASSVTMIMEQRFLPSSISLAEVASDGIPIISCEGTNDSGVLLPTVNGNVLHGSKEGKANKSPSNEKLLRLCLPLKFHTEEDVEDGYEMHRTLLTVASDRWGQRRMTDPGAGIKLEKPENTPIAPVADAIDLHLAKSQSATNVNVQKLASEHIDVTSPSTSSESVDIPERLPRDGGDQQKSFDEGLVGFVQVKELFKQRLFQCGFRGYIYSDLARIAGRRPFFSQCQAKKEAVSRRSTDKLHLVVFVHGLEGTCDDLTVYRNYLRVTLEDCNLEFLMSESNQNETWSDLSLLAENLLQEICRYVERMPRQPDLISMVAHSMGGLIVRTMCALDGMSALIPKLHTLLTLNSPHCGLLYNQRAANWGITLLQWWKQSAAIGQLTLKDAINFRDCFLYRLSANGAFGLFRYVLLVGSYNDLYVPGHSALIEPCKASLCDPSAQGTVYSELVANVNESIMTSPRKTTLVKYTVSHPLSNVPRSQQVMGRAVHIAAVDDETFIETLISVSATKYFR